MLAKLPEYEQRVSVRQFHQVPGSVSVHLFLTFRTSAIVLPIPVPDVSPSIIQTCERCLQAAYDVVSGRQVALDPSNFIKYCDACKISFVSYVSPKLPAAGLLAEAPAAYQHNTDLRCQGVTKCLRLFWRPLMGLHQKQPTNIPQCALHTSRQLPSIPAANVFTAFCMLLS